MELAKSSDPKRHVSAPRGLIEGPSRRVDSSIHVYRRRIGPFTDHFLGRRIHIRVAGPILGLGQLTINEENARSIVSVARQTSSDPGARPGVPRDDVFWVGATGRLELRAKGEGNGEESHLCDVGRDSEEFRHLLVTP